MFDWVTWSIWASGLLILVIWVIMPLKEFMLMVREHKAGPKDAQRPGDDRAKRA